MIALSLSLILLSSCGSSKPQNEFQNPQTEQEYHEKALNTTLFGIIIFAVFSAINNTP